MNDIRIGLDANVGFGFVPPEFLDAGEDEYRFRDAQLRAMGKDPGGYRKLKPFELETLVRNHNTCGDWSLFLVTDPFTPELVKNSEFSGMVRLGKLERLALEHHDLHVFAGIKDSLIVACDIGDNCVVNHCAYLAHYIIGDNCILLDNDEIHVSNHAKFGNGIVMQGEREDVRIELDLMNEAGGRSVLPFDGMRCADAYLWARHRGDANLMRAFRAMTESMFDPRRGRYGTIGKSSVLKSNHIIKDVAIGESTYIKGANKLKNLTVNSADDMRTQVGEGVELVNGIVGFGCRVFYGCKAVRFVMGDNSALKYGARLIHSVLGENSTVSCCEILNNLIFPAHEQHHNTSFLIASLVKGQSNMAAGATVGSNHNSRAPDGEIEAGRGFWPGLSTSVKHSSRFASFCLLVKGDFKDELDIPLPFCLVDDDRTRDRLVLVPGYWWTHNLYALMRNESKFRSRDGRRDKSIGFEYSPFAPDTAEEIRTAMGLLEEWTGAALQDARAGAGDRSAAGAAPQGEGAASIPDPASLKTSGRSCLSSGSDDAGLVVRAQGVENSARPAVVMKPARAWSAYREMLLWYAAGTVLRHWAGLPAASRTYDALAESVSGVEGYDGGPAWENLGGQLVPASRLEGLLARAAEGAFASWHDMHAEYARLSAAYPADKARHAWSILGWLYPAGAPVAGSGGQSGAGAVTLNGTGSGGQSGAGASLDHGQSRESLARAFGDLAALADRVGEGVYQSRAKDWANKFRRATFRSDGEFLAVMGTPDKNTFIVKTRTEMAGIRESVREALDSL